MTFVSSFSLPSTNTWSINEKIKTFIKTCIWLKKKQVKATNLIKIYLILCFCIVSVTYNKFCTFQTHDNFMHYDIYTLKFAHSKILHYNLKSVLPHLYHLSYWTQWSEVMFITPLSIGRYIKSWTSGIASVP